MQKFQKKIGPQWAAVAQEAQRALITGLGVPSLTSCCLHVQLSLGKTLNLKLLVGQASPLSGISLPSVCECMGE